MELLIDIKNQMGVYTITNLVNRKVYIGSTTVCLHKRLGQHHSDLRRNTHGNRHLQNSYNLYGDDNFYFESLEIVDVKEKVREREQYWIDIFWGDNCYNIRKDVVYRKGYRHTKKTCDLISDIHTKKCSKLYQSIEILDPKGNLHVFEGSIRRFGKKYGLSYSTLHGMLNGKYKHCKGWSLRNHALPTLISPDGKIFERVYNLRTFAKKHNLSGSILSNMVLGNQQTHKGWTCANPKIK